MNKFDLTVELSGFGHYGVKTVIDRDLCFELLEDSRLNTETGWVQPHSLGNFPTRIGYDDSLGVDQQEADDSKLDLLWVPYKLREAMLSHRLLSRFAGYAAFEKVDEKELCNPRRTGTNLIVSVGKAEHGWYVRANLGDQLWDVIESPEFQNELKSINALIQCWWQDQDNNLARAQYASVFRGKDGPTLQVYHPGSKGLWIAGARKGNNEHQLFDHNTDCASDAFSHIISLCIIQKRCREILSESGRS